MQVPLKGKNQPLCKSAWLYN